MWVWRPDSRFEEQPTGIPGDGGSQGCWGGGHRARGCSFSVISAVLLLRNQPGEGWGVLWHPISISTVLRADKAEGTPGLTPAAAYAPFSLSHLFFVAVQVPFGAKAVN